MAERSRPSACESVAARSTSVENVGSPLAARSAAVTLSEKTCLKSSSEPSDWPSTRGIDEAKAAREESDEEGKAAEQAGFAEAQKFLNTARVHTAARAVGLARAALEDSIVYLQEREQFGHPISDFQALRFKIADMAAQVDQARAFYRQVAHLIDLGEPCEREAAMVKLSASEASNRIADRCVQVLGGRGYMREHPVDRIWRELRVDRIWEGTSEIQRLVIANEIDKRGLTGLLAFPAAPQPALAVGIHGA